ncbi:MBL fold metallo-hydrolase [Geoalkalibacter sp.]|uniref:MBL fold metallo-hydrolase n=1 Tax=Geoalkalibacter sp. TaxID=3041440 RepID=UPI00272EAFD7|nr:MBL fold metallo-hydrolase [Geoalkalibacter sp.]
MPVSLSFTILCENTVGRPVAAVGEHGFACLIETAAGTSLFDTGQGLGLLQNARALRKDLAQVDRVILSHGHYDHAGGLPDLLRLRGETEVVAHPGIFVERWWAGLGPRRFIGIPYQRAYLESLGGRFRFEKSFAPIADGMWVTGDVPRHHSLEKGDPHMIIVDESGRELPDPLCDDLSLVLETAKGPVVVLGCAHAGLINILRHVRERTGWKKIHAVIGGTHLMAASDELFEETVRALDDFGVDKIAAAHCTGLPRAAQLHARFGSRFIFAAVGTVIEV